MVPRRYVIAATFACVIAALFVGGEEEKGEDKKSSQQQSTARAVSSSATGVGIERSSAADASEPQQIQVLKSVWSKAMTSPSGLEYKVPGPVHMQFKIHNVPSLPWVTKEGLLEAQRYLLQFEDDPALRSPQDKAIFKLIKEHMSGERAFNVQQFDLHVGNPEDPMPVRMAYACSLDLFGFGKIQGTTPLLARTLYHELAHKVECLREMEAYGVTDHADMFQYAKYNPCRNEPPGFAAEVRIWIAIWNRGLRNLQFSKAELSDRSSTMMMDAAWKALYNDKFCAWQERQIQMGGHAPIQYPTSQ